jgi:hypothetical protein
MSNGGPVGAVSVCQKEAPHIAERVLREAGKSKWSMGRTSERIRNPHNAPNDWQLRGLKQLALDAKRSGGAPVEWRERGPTGSLRYMRGIVLGPLCVGCHGTPDQIAPEVREQLSQAYPADQATGFAVGDLRGAFFVQTTP